MDVAVLDSEYFRAVAPRVADGSLPAFLAQLGRVAGCAKPVRLAGTVDQVDTATGEVRRTLDTAQMPDGALLVPCGNRRASVCPSCSYLYAGDAWQIVHAGLSGGPGVPPSVASHPGLFVTVTAPSFGPVHSRRANHGSSRACRPRRGRCPHHIASGCFLTHSPDDPRVGQAICPDCYDYPAQVVWNASASRLWKRTVDLTYRRLASVTGRSERAVRRELRISYVKVAEMQARGVVHFHAILRLDGFTSEPGVFPPPPEWATGRLLVQVWRWAATRASQPCPDPHIHDLRTIEDAVVIVAGGGLLGRAHITPPTVKPAPMGEARWGNQTDIRPIAVEAGELTPATVGNYLAKYVTKSTTTSGLLDRRIRNTDDLTIILPFLTAHQAALVKTGWRLGLWPEYEHLRLRRHAHEYGFRGHWLTKSRRYSTTFTERRQARRTWQRTHTPTGEERTPLDAWGRSEDDDHTITVAQWRFHSVGYRSDGDRWLALQAADQARSRRAARDSAAALRAA